MPSAQHVWKADRVTDRPQVFAREIRRIAPTPLREPDAGELAIRSCGCRTGLPYPSENLVGAIEPARAHLFDRAIEQALA